MNFAEPPTRKVGVVICVLSGGVGAARLLRAMIDVVEPTSLVAVVNVGDDVVIHGLTVCPDIDTIIYTLAGLSDDARGWGLGDESWRVMEELDALGGESWFRLGDRDLATHLYRSQRLAQGLTKTDVTRELAVRRRIPVTVLPVTDDVVSTEFDTNLGRLTFQEYFVRHRHDLAVRAINVVGLSQARATSQVISALRESDRIVIAPSNPLISIDPLLRVPGVRDAIAHRRGEVVAVSPIVGGAALKGPADRLLHQFGHDVSPVGVADFYGDVVDRWIIDEVDAAYGADLRARGFAVTVTTTVMAEPHHARRLAEAVLA